MTVGKNILYAATTLLPPLKSAFAVDSLFRYFLSAWSTSGEDSKLDDLLNAAALRRNEAIEKLSNPGTDAEHWVADAQKAVESYISCLRHFVQAKAPDLRTRNYDPIERGSKEEADMIRSHVCRAVPFQWQDVLSDDPSMAFSRVDNVWHMGFDGASMLISLGVLQLRAANQLLEAGNASFVDSKAALTAHKLLLQAAGVFLHINQVWLKIIGHSQQEISSRDCTEEGVSFFRDLAFADAQSIAVMQGVHSREPREVAAIAWDTADLYDGAAAALCRACEPPPPPPKARPGSKAKDAVLKPRTVKEGEEEPLQLQGWPLLAASYLEYKSATMRAYALLCRGEAAVRQGEQGVGAGWLRRAEAAHEQAAVAGVEFHRLAARGRGVLPSTAEHPLWLRFDATLSGVLHKLQASLQQQQQPADELPADALQPKRVVRAKEWLMPDADPQFEVAGGQLGDMQPPEEWEGRRHSMLQSMSTDSWSDYILRSGSNRGITPTPLAAPAESPPLSIAPAPHRDGARGDSAMAMPASDKPSATHKPAVADGPVYSASEIKLQEKADGREPAAQAFTDSEDDAPVRKARKNEKGCCSVM